MKNDSIRLILFLISIFALPACTDTTHKKEQLRQAETLINTHPDSALSVLQSIDSPEKMSHKDYATWCLLRTQADDKNYIRHTSDSLINIAVDYFEKTEDKERKAEAWYYKGRVNEDMNYPLQAQKYYLEALRDEKQNRDYALLGRINNNIGMLYTYQMVYEKALPFQKKAVEYFNLINDSTGQVFALRNLSRTYLMLEYKDSAILSNQKTIPLMKKKVIPSVYTELASLYMGENRIKESYELLQIALQNTPKKKSKYPIYLVMGCLFKQCGQIDSARFYLQSCMDSAPLLATRAAALSELKELAFSHKQWEKAALLGKQYELLRDSIEKNQQTESIRKTEALYSYTQIEHELLNTQLYASNLKLKNTLVVSISLFILLLAISYDVYYRKEQKTLRSRLQENLAQMANDEETIERLENILKETPKELEHLQTLHDDLKTSRLHNNFCSPYGWTPSSSDWESLYQSIDTNCPSFIISLNESLPNINVNEKRLCYLIRIGARPSTIAVLLDLSSTSISMMRKRLYERISMKKGSAKDFDNYILDL